MSEPFYASAYHAAYRRWAEGVGDREWQEWAEEVGKIKRAWKWAVNGMLTQLDREDPEIWYALGEACLGGHGIERDRAQGEMWIRKAAETGHVKAMTRLGMILRHPERSEKEVRESVDWFLRAAEHGDSYGMTSLGFAFREGDGVPVDERIAADWFIKAYEAGSKSASELAGRLLSYHPENHVEAVKWLRVAVDHGYVDAYYNLAMNHEDRSSPAYDPEEAFRCWLRVAERPSGDLRFSAMWRLASCCRDGIGTERSNEEAKRWLDRIIAVAPKEKYNYRDALKRKREIDEELF